MENLTPMLQQYKQIKNQYKDCILFFRLGDFYEMFYEDAKLSSGILDVVLTARGAGKSGKVPMCGIPYHAADNYILKLIKAGQKVAICEQVQDPAIAKGLVKREVIRVITCGTYIDENQDESRFIICFYKQEKTFAIAFTDINSGKIFVNEYPSSLRVVQVLSRLNVYECLFAQEQEAEIKNILSHPLLCLKKITLSPYQDWCFNYEIAHKTLVEHFRVRSMAGFGLENLSCAISSAGALLEYLRQINRKPMQHIDAIARYFDSDYMYISPAAYLGLELDSLFEHIDTTYTAFGKRKLKHWLYHPLKDVLTIIQRQEAIEILRSNSKIFEQTSELLRNLVDVEKSLSRISCGYTYARDLLGLRTALLRILEIKEVISPVSSKNQLFILDDVEEIRSLLTQAINPEVPLSHPEGKIINKGYNPEFDELSNLQNNARIHLKDMQMREIKRTGINSLKIGFNKIFGYYIEISNANRELVPSDYIRKQTLVNAERFITQELKEFEEKMLTAEEKVLSLETKLLKEIYEKILEFSQSLHTAITQLSILDTLCSLVRLAQARGYIKPTVSEDTEIIIKEGRHPVIEHLSLEPFVANDILLDSKENHLLIITGPNMAGKSTYIRQTAILVVLAQIGSWIPASYAHVGIVDKIFTRIGAHDEISKGQSTFMVEMIESADILNNLSPRSLIILDEVGRGTSTFDGLSLAWAIAHYLHKKKVRTLFATHFHELTVLAQELKGVKNYNVLVKEYNEKVVFLHKIIPGGSDDSYGIYVAQLAGIPSEVVRQAKEFLAKLEIQADLKEKIVTFKEDKQFLLEASESKEPNLLEKEICEQLMSLDVNSLTPLEVSNKVQEWKEKIKDGIYG